MSKDYVSEGRYLDVTLASRSSGDIGVKGHLAGVCLTDTVSGNVRLDTEGVYKLYVEAINDAGNSAVAYGDRIYASGPGAQAAGATVLSKDATGTMIGHALGVVTSGAIGQVPVRLIGAKPATDTPVETADLADGAVTTDKLGGDAVTEAKLADDAVSTDKLVDAAVTTAKIAGDAVTETELADDAVSTGKIVDEAVDETKVKGNLAVGYIPLDITSARLIAGDAIGNTTEGMLPDGNTDPILARVNGATDKALRLTWAAGSTVEVQFPPIPKPPDMDGGANATIHLMLAKDTNTDNGAVVGVSVWDGVGDANAGGNTAALAAAALAEKTVTIALADLADPPGFLNVSVTPGAHAADAIYLYAAWIEYARKG